MTMKNVESVLADYGMHGPTNTILDTIILS